LKAFAARRLTRARKFALIASDAGPITDHRGRQNDHKGEIDAAFGGKYKITTA